MGRYGGIRSLHEGIMVRRWETGPNQGKPKPTAAVQSMLDRSLLMLVDDGAHWLKATFSAVGIAALRLMASDMRALPQEECQQLLDELAEMPLEGVPDGR